MIGDTGAGDEYTWCHLHPGVRVQVEQRHAALVLLKFVLNIPCDRGTGKGCEAVVGGAFSPFRLGV